MPHISVYNIHGKPVETIILDDGLFGEDAAPALLWQVVRVLESRQREPLAHAKDRSEVRGGGKKPWRQKGTGRARHGSIRSPLWRGGGVTFGPRKEHISKLSIPLKMKQKALRAILSQKVIHKHFFVIDTLAFEKPSTQTLFALLNALQISERSTMLVLGAGMDAAALSARNIPHLDSVRVENVNVLNALKYENIIIQKSDLESITTRLKQAKS